MKSKITITLIFLAVITSSFYFGFSRLTNFSGVDEPYWSYGRVPNFWNAVKTMQWKKTNICDKPGVPLAMVSGAGLPFLGENPKSLKSLRYEAKTPEQLQKIQDLYFHLRLPVFLFTLLILPLFYFLIKKLLGEQTAKFATIFIGFSPVLLGISLIINSDAMLWILTALSTLSLFVFLKNDERKYLLLSGFFLGLSVITKYVANVLFVYFFLVFLLEYILWAHKNMDVEKYLKLALKNYLILFATAMATAFVFFPATWVKLSTLFHATLGNPVFSSTWPLFVGTIGLLAIDILVFKAKFSSIAFAFFVKHRNLWAKISASAFLFLIVFVLLHVYAGLKTFDLQAIIASPKGIGSGDIIHKYLGALSGDMYSLIFSISPLVLFLLMFAIFSIFRKKDLARENITAIYIIIFILIFYLGSAVNAVVNTVRYQIMVYPLAFVLAAIGISEILKNYKIKKFVPLPTVFVATILILVSSLYFVKPNYLAYASEILPNNFIVNLKGMGEGSYEAATFLNNLPNAHDMTIWSDKGAVCERFVGRCFIDFKKATFEKTTFDYFVVSTDRKSRTLKLSGAVRKNADFAKAYETKNPAFDVIVDNNPNNFVKVIKAADITIKQ
ncbi:MAG: glycosyltransferase family 39 protein [Candidatus Moranbacteria bacterium]|nr:glycosyltransferase family 39 protein [Candidatus Moranbacteria bacterium]